ncbi:MAG TPA: iron-sulfur cluster insertion protein ErpA [Candidatus Saccharimonadales bacterium]|nr:iron-sulfur cluster insertion protein ErpA [Candidatus Saccharimonadales bacterium]
MSEATETILTISERAAQEIKSVMEKQGRPGTGLRVYVAGGGCSGLQYGMQLTDETEAGDLAFEAHGVRVLVDPQSAQYLRGASIDWEGSLVGGGFRIENPNAVKSCGCGQSFTPEGGEEAQGGGSGCGGCGGPGC